jgi:hypothetical protein
VHALRASKMLAAVEKTVTTPAVALPRAQGRQRRGAGANGAMFGSDLVLSPIGAHHSRKRAQGRRRR